jgi:protein-L-isoaspartate O-methyltransferase
VSMAKLCRAVTYAQHLQKYVVNLGAVVVDATAGKGHDTEFLARLVGITGLVYAFDIQQEALDLTHQRLKSAGLEKQTTCCHAGHEYMLKYINFPVQAVMFNLGYLPGGSHDIITRSYTTVQALQAATQLLAVGGLITVVVYPGHPGGIEEQQAVECFASSLPQQQFIVIRYAILNQVNNPPLVVAIERIS